MNAGIESFEVSKDNPVYTSYNGVLFSKDMTKLILYPFALDAEDFIVPDGVTEICADAFYKKETLATVTIPSSVMQIGENAFFGTPLSDIYYEGDAESFEKIIIGYGNEDFLKATIHYNCKP